LALLALLAAKPTRDPEVGAPVKVGMLGQGRHTGSKSARQVEVGSWHRDRSSAVSTSMPTADLGEEHLEVPTPGADDFGPLHQAHREFGPLP
jgi:hypothetical protein